MESKNTHSSSHVIKLGQWFATAICGNDILSSALYVSGIAAIFAGVYAPLVLLAIGIVLYFYKAVYTEVVEALPVNGGAYNCLLNGTSKTIAAIAGVMTILSYIATAVLSAKVGIEYVNSLFRYQEITMTLPILGTIDMNMIIIETIALLLLFAMLVISGLKDSAKVALGIFIFHIISLIAFVIAGGLHYFSGHSMFAFNLGKTITLISDQGGLVRTMILAFSACLLGVSGFESSANFVEEQDKGVFRKTLRNMLIGVVIFNPLIALVLLNTLPVDAIAAAKDFVLADAAKVIGGQFLQAWIVIDAFLVLSGAVLTSFVGVSGLVNRMSLDSCLPGFLAVQNSKGTFTRIVIAFFILCSSILIITRGELLSLAGVYTIAFLSVMSLFALGNLILKETRTELKRTYKAPRRYIISAFLATVTGIVGNILIDERNLVFFSMYFFPSLLIVFAIFYQDKIFTLLLRITKVKPELHEYISRHFNDMIEGKFVIFIRNIDRLYDILTYVNRNETGWNITLVHCENKEGYEELKSTVATLQRAGVFPHFKIQILYRDEAFGPHMIDVVSKELGVHKNRILIGSIHHHHPFEYDELGGVRIIY